MSFLPDFNEIDRRNDQWREYAKATFVNGIDAAELIAGMKVTISPNLRYQDNSYTREVLTVVASNALSVQVRLSRGELVVLSAHEHHFYSAESFEDDPR